MEKTSYIWYVHQYNLHVAGPAKSRHRKNTYYLVPAWMYVDVIVDGVDYFAVSFKAVSPNNQPRSSTRHVPGNLFNEGILFMFFPPSVARTVRLDMTKHEGNPGMDPN